MKKILNLIVAVPFCIALTAPAVIAGPIQDHDDHEHRYYDEDHKDYHQWNASEQRYWHSYWKEQHRKYVDWDRANDEQHRAYWKWRHDHDHDHDHDDRR